MEQIICRMESVPWNQREFAPCLEQAVQDETALSHLIEMREQMQGILLL